MSDERLIRIEEKIDKLLVTSGVADNQAKNTTARVDKLESKVENMQKYIYMGLGIVVVVGALLKLVK